MTDKFKARYEVADGYVGKSRPQYCSIDSSSIEDDMDDDTLAELYFELIQEHFERNICPEGENLEEFMAWAKEIRDSK